MIPLLEWVIRCTVICALCSQAVCQESIETIPWEPSLLVKPTDEIPKGSVPKSMVKSLRVSGITIILEETKLIDLQTRLGSMVGHRGDAAGYLEWLCYEVRSDSHRSLLWLMGGETDAGTVGGFQWLQITGSTKVDVRCQPLRNGTIELPHGLKLGLTRPALVHTLGKPTRRHANRFDYVHEEELQIRNEPFTEANSVSVFLRNGIAWCIEVWKSTVS